MRRATAALTPRAQVIGRRNLGKTLTRWAYIRKGGDEARVDRRRMDAVICRILLRNMYLVCYFSRPRRCWTESSHGVGRESQWSWSRCGVSTGRTVLERVSSISHPVCIEDVTKPPGPRCPEDGIQRPHVLRQKHLGGVFLQNVLRAAVDVCLPARLLLGGRWSAVEGAW